MAPPWRTSPLPPDWASRRSAVLARDSHECQIKGPKCRGKATEVDHTGHPDDHRLIVLQSVCKACHASKTGREARAKQGKRRREPEPHPGTITRAQRTT